MQKAWDLPHLVGSLCAGEVSLDKVRAVADVATPETDRELCREAKEHSVRELAEVARTSAQRTQSLAHTSAEQHERRFVRFNDTFRTVTAQLPAESYAETTRLPRSGGQRHSLRWRDAWDQRLCDAFMGLVRSAGTGTGTNSSASPHVVVVHVPLEGLVAEAAGGEATELAGELERDGLIDCATVQRIAVMPPSPWPSTTTWATPCTRVGPSASPPLPNDGKCGGGIDIVAFRVVSA